MTEPRRPASRRVITRITLVVLAAIAAVAVFWALARSGTTPAPPPVAIGSAPSTASATITDASATAPASQVTQTVAAGGTRPANGCLGGPDPYQAVLPAQSAATPDQVGAAEFALTFARWTVAYPIDPIAPTVLAQVAAPGYQPVALKGLDDYGRALSAAGYTTAGATPGAANQYRIRSGEEGLDPTHVQLDMIIDRQSTKPNGEVDTVRGFTTLLLDLVDGHWQIAGSLPAIGSDPFAPRADAPWVPYVGTC